jgi:tight adherence protein B
MTYGLDLRDALQRMAQRIPIPELQYMISAIKIQHVAGGSLTGVLSSLAALMRERLKLQMKVRALSAEARLSGRVLACMPFAVFGLIYLRDPHFYDAARENPVLAAALYFAAFLVFGGIYLLRRIVNIRV